MTARDVQTRTCARQSPQMESILAHLVVADGEIEVSSLVGEQVRQGKKPSVAKASVSRTLRRMWQRGLVELNGTAGWRSASATQVRQADEERLARAEEDPEEFYAGYLDWLSGISALRGVQVKPRFHSADALLTEKRRQVADFPRIRVVRVALTDVGREAVNSLAGARVNRELAVR